MLIDILIFTYIERTEKTIYINATYNEKTWENYYFYYKYLWRKFLTSEPGFKILYSRYITEVRFHNAFFFFFWKMKNKN